MVSGLPIYDSVFFFSFNIPVIDDMVSFLLSHEHYSDMFDWEIVDRRTGSLIGRSADYLGI